MADLELPPELSMIDPPPGGLARLRARIADADRRRASLRWVPLVTVVAAVIVWLARPHSQPIAPVAASTLLPDPAVGVAFYWVAPTMAAHVPRNEPSFVDISAVTITP
jgi:hypothetical protein